MSLRWKDLEIAQWSKYTLVKKSHVGQLAQGLCGRQVDFTIFFSADVGDCALVCVANKERYRNAVEEILEQIKSEKEQKEKKA